MESPDVERHIYKRIYIQNDIYIGKDIFIRDMVYIYRETYIQEEIHIETYIYKKVVYIKEYKLRKIQVKKKSISINIYLAILKKVIISIMGR